MMESGKKRKLNLTDQEVKTMIQEVKKRKSALLGIIDKPGQHKAKEMAWQEITSAVNAVSRTVRDPKELRKKFADYRSLVKRKMAAVKRQQSVTSSGMYAVPSLTNVDEEMLSMISNESFYGIEGVMETEEGDIQESDMIELNVDIADSDPQLMECDISYSKVSSSESPYVKSKQELLSEDILRVQREMKYDMQQAASSLQKITVALQDISQSFSKVNSSCHCSLRESSITPESISRLEEIPKKQLSFKRPLSQASSSEDGPTPTSKETLQSPRPVDGSQSPQFTDSLNPTLVNESLLNDSRCSPPPPSLASQSPPVSCSDLTVASELKEDTSSKNSKHSKRRRKDVKAPDHPNMSKSPEANIDVAEVNESYHSAEAESVEERNIQDDLNNPSSDIPNPNELTTNFTYTQNPNHSSEQNTAESTTHAEGVHVTNNLNTREINDYSNISAGPSRTYETNCNEVRCYHPANTHNLNPFRESFLDETRNDYANAIGKVLTTSVRQLNLNDQVEIGFRIMEVIRHFHKKQ